MVLVGPPASGKSTWAAEQFPADQVVSSDRMRALVGTGEHDQRASQDASTCSTWCWSAGCAAA